MIVDEIKLYFLLFMTYSILGWMLEVTCKLIQYKRFINRGFLIGPYCPIYGYGAILITLLLGKYKSDPITLFIMTIVLCGTLEYLTSYFMEKIFKARWWDYSKRKFNLNGRVCLGTLLPFGIFGMILMYIANPFFIGKIQELSPMWTDILFWSLLVIYIIDNIVSEIVIGYVKKTEKRFTPEVDNTEEMTEKIKAVLEAKSPLHRRLLRAYPKLQAVKVKIKEKQEEIKEQIIEQKKEIADKAKKVEEKVEYTTKKVSEKVKEFKDKK